MYTLEVGNIPFVDFFSRKNEQGTGEARSSFSALLRTFVMLYLPCLSYFTKYFLKTALK